MKRKERGVTLIALVVTIVVLLILASIGIGAITSDNGVIKQSNETKQSAERESIIEKIEADLYTEKTKTGKTINKEGLKKIILKNNYNDGTLGIEGFNTKIGNYNIKYKEISGWDNIEEIEYIESTGIQYIDTGMKLNQDSRVEIKFELTDKNYSYAIFGSRTSATENNIDILFAKDYGDKILSDFQNYKINRFENSILLNQTVDVLISKNKMKIGNQEYNNVEYTNFETPSNALIFRLGNNMPNGYKNANMKLYYCKIWDKNKLVRDFIPVIKEGNIACLYDKIEKKYYENQGTGEFIAGKIYDNKYIESTGTQYIDTGVKLNQDSRVNISVDITDKESPAVIFGSRMLANKDNIDILYNKREGIIADFENYEKNRLKNTDLNIERVEIFISKEKIKIGNEILTNLNYTSFTTPSNALIFSTGNNQPSGYKNANMKLYYCQIYDGDKMIREFMPTKDKDNIACLYDTVEGKYYYNQGTGEFLYGE